MCYFAFENNIQMYSDLFLSKMKKCLWFKSIDHPLDL